MVEEEEIGGEAHKEEEEDHRNQKITVLLQKVGVRDQNLRRGELKVDLVEVQVTKLIREVLVFLQENKKRVVIKGVAVVVKEPRVGRQRVVRIREDLECAEDAEGEVEEEVEQEIL